jgi:hypothetical protein
VSGRNKQPRRSSRDEYRRQTAQGNLKRLADAWARGGEKAFEEEWERLFAKKRTEVTPMADFWPGGRPDSDHQ